MSQENASQVSWFPHADGNGAGGAGAWIPRRSFRVPPGGVGVSPAVRCAYVADTVRAGLEKPRRRRTYRTSPVGRSS